MAKHTVHYTVFFGLGNANTFSRSSGASVITGPSTFRRIRVYLYNSPGQQAHTDQLALGLLRPWLYQLVFACFGGMP